jgi:hypothetical protein
MPHVRAADNVTTFVELDYGISVASTGSINVDLTWPMTAAALEAGTIVQLDDVTPPDFSGETFLTNIDGGAP